MSGFNTERVIAELIVKQASQRNQLAGLGVVFAYVAAYLLADLSKGERVEARKAIHEAIDDAIHELGVCPDCQTEPVN